MSNDRKKQPCLTISYVIVALFISSLVSAGLMSNSNMYDLLTGNSVMIRPAVATPSGDVGDGVDGGDGDNGGGDSASDSDSDDMGADDMGADDMGADDMGADDMGADDMGADDMVETDWHLEPHGDTSALAQAETGGHHDLPPTITTSTQTPSGGGTTEGPLGGGTTQTPSGGGTTQTPTLTPGANAQQAFRIENTTGSAQGDDFATTILAINNRERALVGVPPLTWNNTLAADAQVYVDYLAATGQFHHPTAEWVAAHPTGPEGENLAAQFGGGPLNGTQLGNFAEGWVSEKPLYHGQPIAASLAPGEKTFGHYSQMVWKSTTSVGCASAYNSATQYTVVSCRYSPPGNYIGQTPF